MHIGFVVDHPKRDLQGAIMLAHALVQRGHHASIIPLYEQAVDVPLLGLDALIVNYARPANIDLVQGYVDMGLPVFVLDTEGGVLAEDGANAPDELAAYIRNSGYAKLLAGYLFWGSRLRQAFVNGSGMLAENLYATGCPRFDYASPRWCDVLDFPHGDYILVNANFPLVNPLFVSNPEEEKKTLTKAGWKVEYVDKLLADQRDILRNFLSTVNELAAHFPDRTFLVRPHPFENPDLYRDTFAAQPNVIVDGQGSVLNVIRHADCVLHLNCGTSVEATMLGRLPISLEFLNTQHMAKHSTLPSRISLRAESVEAVAAVLERLPEAVSAFDFDGNYQQFIHPWFHENDGAAAERVVEAVGATLARRGHEGGRVSIARSLANSRRNSRPTQYLQSALANLLGSRATSALRAMASPARREKQIAPTAVEAQLALLADHAGTQLPRVRRASHPWTGLPLVTLTVSPS